MAGRIVVVQRARRMVPPIIKIPRDPGCSLQVMSYYVSGRITAGSTLMLRIIRFFPIGAGMPTLAVHDVSDPTAFFRYDGGSAYCLDSRLPYGVIKGQVGDTFCWHSRAPPVFTHAPGLFAHNE